MKKPTTISEQDRKLLAQLDALIGSEEPTAEELAAELAECGVDPKELKESSFQRVRAYATEKYSSRGLNVPPLMSEALRQMRPPTPQEEEAASAKRATSRVQSLLASLKSGVDSFSGSYELAPAYRNKKDETPNSDQEILDRQQKDLDQKTKRANNE